MGFLRSVYRSLPKRFQPPVRTLYKTFHPNKKTSTRIQRNFEEQFFDSTGEYRSFKTEFEDGPVTELRNEGLSQFSQLTGDEYLGGIDLSVGKQYYALVRKLKPDVVVETGVCNGVSTLCLLLALDRNEHGILHSIDYPYRTSQPLDEFRMETFDEYRGAAIPAEKDPGWIIPDPLRQYWELHIGKSQRELPQLVSQLDSIDFFVHDSEHSVPCMMLELELAWEWLSPGGVIVVDDIGWNDAVDIFTKVRQPTHGLVTPGVAYMTN